MSATLTSMRFTLPFLALSATLIACTGGGGGVDGSYQDTQDPVVNSLEGVSSTAESTRLSNEGAASTTEGTAVSGGSGAGTGAGGFDCSGSYRCAVTAAGRTVNQTLNFGGSGACVAGDAAFNADGTVSGDDGVVGTWRATPGGFTVTGTTKVDDNSVEFTFDCTRVAGGDVPSPGQGDDDDDSSGTGQR